MVIFECGQKRQRLAHFSGRSRGTLLAHRAVRAPTDRSASEIRQSISVHRAKTRDDE